MSLNRIRPYLALLLLAALALVPAPALSQDEAQSGADASSQAPGNIMFILDVSGSMWGQVDGRSKIEIARESMAAVIESLPAGINAGLTAYGHRREGDCTDVEELVPLQPLDRELLISHINELTPLGKTPITHSIEVVARTLRTLETPTTILLVSDGKETCEGDPCALAAELRAAGLRLVIDVIGFDVTPEEREQLMCIAEQGGGTYYDADSVEDFLNAAQAAVAKPELTGSTVHVTALRNGEEIQTFVHVLDAEGQEIDLRLTTPGLGETIALVPGDYTIVVQDTDTMGKPSQSFPITVESEDLEVVADFTVGTLRIATTRNGEPRECSLRVYAPESGEELAYAFSDNDEHVAEINVPGGTYDIEITDRRLPDSPAQYLRGVAVASGQVLEFSVDFPSGRLVVPVTRNGEPIKGEVSVRQDGHLVVVESSSPSEPADIELLAGDYQVEVEDTEAGSHISEATFPVTIERLGVHETPVDFALGQVDVSVPGASDETVLIVYKPGTDGNFLEMLDVEDGHASVLLEPNTYKIEVEDRGNDTSQVFDGVVITPGETVTLQADMER